MIVGDDCSLRADCIWDFLEALSFCSKTSKDVEFIVCDNDATMKAVSTKLKVLVIGCGSYWLSLADKHSLNESSFYGTDVIISLDTFYNLMLKKAKHKQLGASKQNKSLRPVVRYKTRWSSNYQMLQRYFELTPCLHNTGSTMTYNLPTACQNAKLKGGRSDFESVTLKLLSAKHEEFSN